MSTHSANGLERAAEESDTADVVVVGSGIAGLSAAVAAAEQLAGRGRVIVLDRAPEGEAGGNTKWTDAYFRMDDLYEPARNFAGDMADFSGGRAPHDYVVSLLERLPETMEWIQGHGVRFDRRPGAAFFITSVRPRLRPRGGGEGLRNALLPAAANLGVEFRYETTVNSLVTGSGGEASGVSGYDSSGAAVTVPARTVVIASGGFEGDPAYLSTQLGADASALTPIAPGTTYNRGEGIRMALAAGAARAGQWNNFHAEPIDPRSTDAEAVVMVFPYGILVNRDGLRFIDEGLGTVDETYEQVARTIWSEHNGSVWFISDRQLELVETREQAILSSVRPIVAGSLDELAAALELPAAVLGRTVAAFNAATAADGRARFNWRVCDGVATEGLQPPKSNWALPLDTPPYLAYPVGCAIVFTFGGLATDTSGRVVRDDKSVIPGLYAAGECTGLYHDKYPGGTSVMRGMVFGRAAGTDAARVASELRPR